MSKANVINGNYSTYQTFSALCVGAKINTSPFQRYAVALISLFFSRCVASQLFGMFAAQFLSRIFFAGPGFRWSVATVGRLDVEIEAISTGWFKQFVNSNECVFETNRRVVIIALLPNRVEKGADTACAQT